MICIVTVKLSKKETDKKYPKPFGPCGCKENLMCSDKHGEHHSFLMIGDTFAGIEERARQLYGHVTRVEHPYFTGLGISEDAIEEMIEEG
jgi:hypothetical protein